MSARRLIAALVLTWMGCDRQPASAPSAAQTTMPEQGRPASASPPVKSAPADHVQATLSLGELTHAVRKYAAEQRRVPNSLEELVNHGYLARVPPPPPGKKFAINKNLEVELANPP